MKAIRFRFGKTFGPFGKKESGQGTFVAVLIVLVLGAVVLTPLLAFTIGGLKEGQAHQDSAHQFYAADTGIEDAMWKIRNYEDEDWPEWMRGAWTEATYTHDPPYWEYILPQADVNGKDVVVRIQPYWILEGLETPKPGQLRTPNDYITITGSVTGAGKYEVAILRDDTCPEPLMIERIGVWLPTGYTYVAGSSNLERLSNPLPPAGYRCTPTTYAFRNGTVIVWDYVASYGQPISYDDLPLDKSGTVTAYTFNHLRDTVNNQFSMADVGRSVWDSTDDQWGLIADYNSPSDLTLASNLFDSGDVGNNYEIGETNRRAVTFSYTDSVGGIPDGAFSWVSSPGNEIPEVPPYLWWTGDKLFQVVSIGSDPVTGDLTTITAYTTKEQLRGLGGAMNADYEAIGNTLLMDYLVDNPYGEGDRNGSERGDGLYRDRLYESSPAQLTTLPAGSSLQQVRLYWSGWKNDPWDIWDISDAARSVLVSQNFVDRVSFRVEVAGLPYETIVMADSWQVLPSGSDSYPRGWNYSCYADVTVEVEAARQYFLDHGIIFTGNAKYTVGHADASDFTTESLQGIWGSSASDVYMVGRGGSILHYDGVEWTLMSSGTVQNLYGVWGSSATDVFAVGAGGTILHYDGSAWTSMNSGTTRDLRGIWGTGANDVFAVGASGTIRHYDGASWSSMNSGTSNTLYGVWGSASNNVFAVGSDGTVCRYTGGASWTRSTMTRTSDLYAVWGSDANNVFAVGEQRTVFKFSGSSWSEIDYYAGSWWTPSPTLYGVWGSASNDVFAVGTSGTIRKWNGSSWSTVSSGTSTQLNGIWGSAANNIFAVGNGGLVVYYDGVDHNGDGSLWDPMIGETSLYEWKDSHIGETETYRTAYPLANTTSYGSTRLDQAAYGAWSMLVIYSSPETKGHQLYLYDTFRFYWHAEDTFLIENFLAPQDVLTDPNAARLTIFVGEGDDVLTGEKVSVNGVNLLGGIPFSCNPMNNIFNSRSSVVGTENIGIDIDTFGVAYPIISPGNTTASISIYTNDDGWCMVYMIMSFRSSITSGGISSIKVV